MALADSLNAQIQTLTRLPQSANATNASVLAVARLAQEVYNDIPTPSFQ